MVLLTKCQSVFFLRASMAFDGALVTLGPQNYVVARKVWAENILLVRGRLVKMQLTGGIEVPFPPI